MKTDLTQYDIPRRGTRSRLYSLYNKRFAILIGYNGAGYYGLQFDRTKPTIETSLFKACVDAHLVLPSNAATPLRVAINRAGRTDKGVSAARNVVSLRLMVSDKVTLESVKDLLNLHLPKGIRVWGVIKTLKK
jgi:tRNA pseudouridine38-40 synthase